ncbi:hypothetical protein NM688_g1507 [Phlebia brevispora]|uniref:Uncharacterized protein n=1 Tax=Phlebia brevispora TaxID=194682 RepID=A0ACC1TB55_9APHY|nr:hypothetical protein NM688_g1507 [Phlebia brevispora]
MPNLLSIPFKRTVAVPIRQKTKDYILAHHTDTHPDAFKWDINRWESLRKDATGCVVHVNSVKVALSYHAQLVYILTKLPNDIGLDIPYTAAFNSSDPPQTLANLSYERAAVLFNLAALHSQLSAVEDRSNIKGLKQVMLHSQNAAGTLNYLKSSALPKLQESLAPTDMPLDFTDQFLSSLEALMLAQAQEAVWQRAILENYKNGVIAKLAAKVATYYGISLACLKEGPPAIQRAFPSGWIAHLETKQLHFEAVAQFRKSVDELEANRYGKELARLTQALALAKNGYDIARRGSVTAAVVSDIKSLLDTLQKNHSRAERDNDLIYHEDVPSLSSLPAIVEVSMVHPLISAALSDPKTAIGDDAVIFGELVAYGARIAIEIYKDRRKNWIQEEIIDRAQRLDDVATSTLRSLNLPAALEALERPVGLPPSLLKKADEALDFLDQEAEEDEVFQAGLPGVRAASQEANKELTTKAEKYRSILQQAGASDQVVRAKWDEWEQNITELTWSNEDLEAAVPSTTVSMASRIDAGDKNSTQSHARQLRVLLESLGGIQRERAQSVARVKWLAESEDITPRVLKAATAIERWVEVQPSMFEDLLDEALEKYTKFREDLEAGEQRQEVLLESITGRNQLFLQSRKEDPSVTDRERALQSLDLAYHKYREVTRNLDEGVQFYNDFGKILTQFRETCRDWAVRRRDEMQYVLILRKGPSSLKIAVSAAN